MLDAAKNGDATAQGKLATFQNSIQEDPAAKRAPSGLPTLPVTLQKASNGPGNVITTYGGNVVEASRRGAFSSICNAGVLYLAPSFGSDTNAGTSETAPLSTIAQAIRNKAGAYTRIVCLEDMVLPSFDLRSTDASQATEQMKILDANGYFVTIRDSGPSLSSVVWAQDTTNTNCWKADLSLSGLAAGQTVTRVLRNDVLDQWGYSKQAKQYTSLALLNAAGALQPFGYYWDNAARTLYLNMSAGSVEAQKANLKGLYTTASGSSRILCYGSTLGMIGVTLEGIQFVHLDQGGRRPRTILHNCKQLWACNKGSDLTNAGDFYISNSQVYASLADGLNGFSRSVTGKGVLFTLNSQFIRSGDKSVFSANDTLQGVSAHGGSHHISWGTRFLDNNGQGVADTTVTGETGDVSWLVACLARSLGESAVPAMHFGSAGTGNRTVVIDRCITETTGVGVMGDVNSTVKVYEGSVGSVSGNVTVM